MARLISQDCYIALECKDLQANTMCIDNSGTYVLLAGRRSIALRNLDEEYEVLHKFPRQSKYDVGVSEWNPTSHHRDLSVISSNERLEVLTWRNESLTQSHSLRAHSRVITDLNWHKFNPNILASCSVDTFIHFWDLRDSRKPTISLSGVAEALQVRWNRISPHFIATAHEGDIKIWDQRKGSSPIQYVAAHMAKIHSLDWSHSTENQIVSSSQDNTVKFFDTTNPRKEEFVLHTNAPVWRARYTPFGNGLVTVVVPQLRRGENSLLLWNTANHNAPVHTFVGHKDVVLEFEWRKSKMDDPNLQLITWSKDQTLLVWKIEPFLQKLCGYEPEEHHSLDGAGGSSESGGSKGLKRMPSRVQLLQQEFSLLNVRIPNLEVNTMDAVARVVTVTTKINSFVVHLQVSFPNSYPHGVPPMFQIINGSSISDNIGTQLLQTLNHLAQQRVSKNRTCLEPCLRQMVATLEQFSTDIENDSMFEPTFIEPITSFNGSHDSYIPFPRTSGAKFCSVATLVCFGRPVLTRRISNKSNEMTTTPRALSALDSKRQTMTVSAYYFQKQKQRSRSRHHTVVAKTSKALVHVYDATGLFYVNRQLAEEYILDGDVGTICKHNAAAAAVVGRSDLVQAWTLAELIAGPQQADEEMSWTVHPFGNKLMKSMISHYAGQSDIQMAAMLCCIFGKDHEMTVGKISLQSLLASGSGGSPYHTIPPADVISDGWVLPLLKKTRSTSLDDLKMEEHLITLTPNKQQQQKTDALYEYYKLSYAETLHRWNLLFHRTEVMKYMCAKADAQVSSLKLIVDCEHCHRPVKRCICRGYRKSSVCCVICHVAVKGSLNFCVICGHGGHTQHLEEWFRYNDICPKCGCNCLTQMSLMLCS